MLPFEIKVQIIASAPYFLSLLVYALLPDQSKILDLLVVKAILGKTIFCIISQIIYIVCITIKHQQEQSKIDEWTLKMHKADPD